MPCLGNKPTYATPKHFLNLHRSLIGALQAGGQRCESPQLHQASIHELAPLRGLPWTPELAITAMSLEIDSRVEID